MLTTRYVPGAPNWIDLGTPDVEAAAAFYGPLLGWSLRSAGPQAGGYGFFELDGKVVAAVGPLTQEGAASAWTPYFRTADADATAKAVEQAGGTVRVAPDDVFDKGRMAGFTDPAGAEFAVWQPGAITGLDLVTENGSLAWLELYVPQNDVVRSFYQTVLGWKIQDISFGDMPYLLLSTPGDDSQDLGGVMGLQEGDRPHWLSYFEVADCDAAVDRVRELGGDIVAPAADIEGVGRFAVAADPFGARFAVIASVG
ncbi:VOC family protein [Streptosporangium sp. DT93]|uniref:VOC family protein n=1 Tax=Streptosporangium sp. DT93 TaxID=3393428 RepID=UPI003CEF5ACD